MAYKEKLELVRQKNSQISKLKKELLDISTDIFDDFRNYIFDKYSKLESFGWNQYTPYFNDGETCVFYANTDYIKINDEWVDNCNWSSEVNIINWGTWNSETKSYVGRVDEPNPDYDVELSNACSEIIEFLNNFDNDFYLDKFGDHAEITVTKNKIDISDCDHE
jgi:hypothetical protein